MKDIIVTNNDYVKDKYKDDFEVIFVEDETDYLEVLNCARDLIHKGYRLLTHPLSGSVKPNETPYKTIIMEGAIDLKKDNKIDESGLLIMEDAILTINKFLNIGKTPNYNEKIKDDCKVIDLSIIENTINLRKSI